MSPVQSPIDWHSIASDDRIPLVVDSRRRIASLLLGFLLLASIVVLRCVWIHVDGGETYRFAALAPRQREQTVPAQRGAIVDRQGKVLAEDQTVDVLAVHYRWLQWPPDAEWLRSEAKRSLSGVQQRSPRAIAAAEDRLRTSIEELAKRLAADCGLSEHQWRSRCRNIQQRVERTSASVNQRLRAKHDRALIGADSARDESRGDGILFEVVQALFAPPAPLPPPRLMIREETEFHAVYNAVDSGLMDRIENTPELYPAVRVEQRKLRIYPRGADTAHVTGYTDSSETGVVNGRAGIELAWNRHLAGRPGTTLARLNRSGETSSETVVQTPLDGNQVALTLDTRLQRATVRFLDDACRMRDHRRRRSRALGNTDRPAGGCVIVMDVHKGDILAAASSPRFDPNDFAGGNAANLQRWLKDPNRAMFDRCLQMAIPPGSVIKPVMAAAILEGTDMDPEAPLVCRGYLRSPDRQRCMLYRRYGVGHGPTNLLNALAHSCNVYFYHQANNVGPETLISWAMRFGFGQKTGIDLPGEVSGNLPTIHSATSEGNGQWTLSDSEALVIGQGRMMATPLQVVRMMAAIANDGYLVTPHVQLSESDDKSSASSRHSRGFRIPGLKDSTLATIRTGLRRVVESPTGTAHRTVFIENLSVAGKTGTAEVSDHQEDHAWFVGYAPADRPRVAVVVCVEHAGDGGAASGPVARQVLLAMQRLGYFESTSREIARPVAKKTVRLPKQADRYSL